MAYITIELTGNEGQTQLDALAALIASLGGRVDVTGERKPVLNPAAFSAPYGDPPIPPSVDNAVDHSDQDAALLSGASANDEQHAMAGAPAVDSNGLPWDARIHSDNRGTNADGSWRRRRGVTDELVASVTAELTGKSVPAVSEAGLSQSTALADTAPPAPVPETPPPPPVETPAPPPAAPAPAANNEPMTFPQFVQAVQAKDVPAEKKAYKALNDLAVTIGVPAFKDMKDHADKFDMFLGMME